MDERKRKHQTRTQGGTDGQAELTKTEKDMDEVCVISRLHHAARGGANHMYRSEKGKKREDSRERRREGGGRETREERERGQQTGGGGGEGCDI